MKIINLLLVPAPGCHPQGIFQIRDLPAQYANLGMQRPLQDD